MPDQGTPYDVLLSYASEDAVWAEGLATRLQEEGIRVSHPHHGLAPSQQMGIWLFDDTAAHKLITICSEHFFRDGQVGLLLENFQRQQVDRLVPERPLVPVLRAAGKWTPDLGRLRPVDFSQQDDFELRLQQLVEALDLADRDIRTADAKNGSLSNAVSTLLRWVRLNKPGAEFADAVAEIYRLLGFEVERKQVIGGAAIDLLIKRMIGGFPIQMIVDCYAPVPTEAQIQEILARQRQVVPGLATAGRVIVTARSSDPKTQTELSSAGINHVTYPKLLGEVVPLESYVAKLLAKLKQERAQKWQNQDWFIRPDVREEDNENSPRLPALKVVTDWLKGKRSNLLSLLGDLGTGKTTLASFLAYEMANAYQADPLRHPAPVLIELKDVRKETSLESIVISHFGKFLDAEKMSEFSFPRFAHLLKLGRVVLLFDAFDEMADRVRPDVMRSNLRELLRPLADGGKVLFTCRTHYFKDQHEEERLLNARSVYLQEFNNEQVRNYLAKARPQTREDDWRMTQVIYNLKELVQRPLLLDMVVKAMPNERSVDAASLYAQYADIWLEREQKKGRLLNKEVKLHLMWELAWQVWDEEKQAIHFQDLLRMVADWHGKNAFDFGDETVDDVAEELRTASFLKRDAAGNYYFADKSFGEYFLARKLYECLQTPKDLDALRYRLSTHRFDPKVIFFLHQLIKDDALYQPLRRILTTDYEARISENALQILYWSARIRCDMEKEVHSPERLRRELAGHIPPGACLANAKLKDFTLEAADLTAADLSGADLTDVRLDYAQLQNASLRGAILSQAKLVAVTAVGADFREAQLSRAIFKRAILRNCDFTGVIHRDAEFIDNDLTGAKGLTVTGNLRRADLQPVVQQFNSSGLHALAFSSNGEYYACGGQEGLIALCRVSDGRLLHLLAGHRGRVLSLHFSPSEALLVSGGLDGSVRLWSVSDGKLHQVLEEHRGPVSAVQFSPDSRWVASGSDDASVRFWSVDDGRVLRLLAGFEGHTKGVNSLSFSPDGKYLASASSDGSARLWQVNTGQPLRILRPDEESTAINVVQFSPDGKLLALGGADSTISFWSVNEGHLLRTLTGHTGELLALSFSPDGKLLASGGKDNFLRVWRVTDARAIYRSDLHSDWVSTVNFSVDGRQLTSGSSDHYLHCWRVKGEELQPQTITQAKQNLRHSAGMMAVQVSPNHEFIASGSEDGCVYLWSARDSGLRLTLTDQAASVNAVAFSPDSRWLASGSDDQFVRLWSVADGRLAFLLKGHTGRISAVNFSPQGKLLASASDDRTLRLWLVNSGEEVASLKGHQSVLLDVAFSPDGSLIASAGEDRAICLWSAKGGQAAHVLKRFEAHNGAVQAVQFSPNGVWLASASKDKTIRLWLVATGQVRHVLEGHTDAVSGLRFSADGSHLASVSQDGSIRVWDVASGELRQLVTTHSGEIYSLAYLPDSERVIAADALGRLQFWDTQNKLLLLSRYGFSTDAWLDLLPDGRFNANHAGRAYLCYTEQGGLHSHEAKMVMTEFYDPEAVRKVLA